MSDILIVSGAIVAAFAIFFIVRRSRTSAEDFDELKSELSDAVVELYYQEASRAVLQATEDNPLRTSRWYLDVECREKNGGAHSIIVNLKEQGRITCCPFQANFYPDRHTWYGRARDLVTTTPKEFKESLAVFSEKIRTFT